MKPDLIELSKQAAWRAAVLMAVIQQAKGVSNDGVS